MAWNPSPKIAMLRTFAQQFAAAFGQQQVIVIHLDRRVGTMGSASYGDTRALCGDAEKLARVAYDAVYRALEEEEA